MKFGVFTMVSLWVLVHPSQTFTISFSLQKRKKGKSPIPMSTCAPPKAEKAKIISIADRRDGTMASNPKHLGFAFCCVIWLFFSRDRFQPLDSPCLPLTQLSPLPKSQPAPQSINELSSFFCWPCLPRQEYCVQIHYRVNRSTFPGLAQIILFSFLPNFSKKTILNVKKSQKFN